jgi:hypothetical protein
MCRVGHIKISREIAKYTVICGAFIRFRPTLLIFREGKAGGDHLACGEVSKHEMVGKHETMRLD